MAGAMTLGTNAFSAIHQSNRKFTLYLSPGAIGVDISPREILTLAPQYGFESIPVYTDFLIGLSDSELRDYLDQMKEQELQWAIAGLPFDFRKDENTFREGIKNLPKYARTMEKAGATRMGTWVLSFNDELTYLENFRQHAHRLREIAKITGDHGIRFGLEYVGPWTSWTSKRFPFIHTMAETKELIAEIGENNVGFILDSYHWHTAGDTVEEIRSLENKDVVSADLNDARDIPKKQMKDLQRMLPTTTGVINIEGFLNALIDIGYDGPVRAEPFNNTVNTLSNKNALRITAETMKKAFAMVE